MVKAKSGILNSLKEYFKPNENEMKTMYQNARTSFSQATIIPEEIRQKIVLLLDARTGRQLELIRKKYADVVDKRMKSLPRDKIFDPIGWSMSKSKQVDESVYGPNETLTYLAYQVNSMYAMVHRVLSDVARDHPDYSPKTICDFGSGPGTAAWAVKEVFPEVGEYRIVEKSQAMVDAANVTMGGFPGMSVRRNLGEMKHELEKNIGYDMVITSCTLSEMQTEYERIATISTLWKLVEENGMLVIIDRGSGWASWNIRSARQLLLDSNEEADTHIAHVVAPCMHQKECPIQPGSWCHFIQRCPQVKSPKLVETKRAQGFKNGKYSYIVFQKLRKDADKIAESTTSRLLRAPLVSNRHVTMDLCQPDGELARKVYTKTKLKDDRERYRVARKCHWGGVWPHDK